MNILLATPFMSQHFDSGLFWAKALCQLGHSLLLWDYRLHPVPPKAKYDFSLVLKGESVDPRILCRPRACYWPDALERTPGIEEVLQDYDKVYTSVRPTPPGMEWLPTGWDPAVHHYTGAPRDIPSLYIGTHNSERKVDFLKAIRPAALAGNGWRGMEGVIYGGYRHIAHYLPPHYLHDFVALASRAKVGINIHQGPVGLNRKLFELIPCTFTITDRVPGVEEMLGDITDEVSFTGPEEGYNFVEWWLRQGNENARGALWEKEKARIMPHTYLAACAKILRDAGSK